MSTKKETLESTDAPQQQLYSDALYDHNAEAGVLGVMFLDEPINRINEIKEDYFYNKHHRVIFRFMREMYDEGKIIDIITLASRMKGEGRFTDAVRDALNEVSDFVLSSAAFENHIKIVRDKYHARMLITSFNQAVALIRANSDTETVAAGMMNNIVELYKESTGDNILNAKEASQKVLDQVENDLSEEGTSIKTGFGDLDRLVGSIKRGSLVVLGGRPGMGKSVTALCMIINNIISGVPCGLVNYEMSTEDTTIRLLSNVARKPYNNILSTLSKNDEQRVDETFASLTHAMDIIAELPLYQEDCPRGDLANLMALIIKMVKVYGCKAIFIDYLQLITAANKNDNRVQELGVITRSLKMLAKQHKIVIFLLAQLNRKVEDRNDKRPHLADLRESGTIEQDADLVWFCYRDEYYNPSNTALPGIMELITAKNRHGKIGTVELYYEEEISLLASLSRDEEN